MWVFAAPLIWEDPIFGKLAAPIGFRTDLASIPRTFRNLRDFDPNGISRSPAAMHDWLYAWRGIGKESADIFLRTALTACGASSFIAETFYLGVHEFGQSSWASDEGALETRDFDTKEHYQAWVDSLTLTSVGPEIITKDPP